MDPRKQLRKTLEQAIELGSVTIRSKSETIDALAAQVGLSRRLGEPDNVLWGRIEGSGQLDELRKQIVDMKNSLGNEEVKDFELALKNL